MVWYKKEKKGIAAKVQGKKQVHVPQGLYAKCKGCSAILYNKELDKNFKVCPKCGYHYQLSSLERLYLTVDSGTFQEFDEQLVPQNPLGFPEYEEKVKKGQEKTKMPEAVVTGLGQINGQPASIAITDFQFMGGSMGSVVGEKITRAIERAIEKKIGMVIVSASGGGARMQEGIFSLMQMAKISAALARLGEAGLPYISVLTDPTAGGVAASFGMLGDVNLAEPGAMIGFAGPRVIEQTIRQKLPKGFQRSEFLVEHGFVDAIVHRSTMKETLGKYLKFFHS
ncbi:MAG TPA: acetyl-CoA carboxylase, carboxyltransferase subunit beta [bacterium]|nr:acetyl-CoA carboxylase, carboxyltransferase subunit beta [bacterium]